MINKLRNAPRQRKICSLPHFENTDTVTKSFHYEISQASGDSPNIDFKANTCFNKILTLGFLIHPYIVTFN